MFIRRLYYDLNTGKPLLSYMAQGVIRISTVQEDGLQYSLENYGCFEWLTPDPEIEAQFENSIPHVDVSGDEPVLTFEPIIDERDEALRILGVELDG